MSSSEISKKQCSESVSISLEQKNALVSFPGPLCLLQKLCNEVCWKNLERSVDKKVCKNNCIFMIWQFLKTGLFSAYAQCSARASLFNELQFRFCSPKSTFEWKWLCVLCDPRLGKSAVTAPCVSFARFVGKVYQSSASAMEHCALASCCCVSRKEGSYLNLTAIL